MEIVDIKAYEVLDSRGTPTVESAVILKSGHLGRFSVPSGASTGTHEALELRDGDKNRYGGLGVLKAVRNVTGPIKEALVGMDASQQREIDSRLIGLDGTPNKSRLGANATLAVSVACAKASAMASSLPMYQYLGGTPVARIPVPMFNVLNGGAHADSGLDVQEYMLVPFGAPTVAEAVRWGVEIYHKLREMLQEKKFGIAVGDEGGFAPHLGSNELALEFLTNAIESAGYRPRQDAGIILDVAASELDKKNTKTYRLTAGGKERILDAEGMIDLYETWMAKYPIIGIEDGLGEDDWGGWAKMTAALGDRIQLLGDDNLVTNMEMLSRAIKEKVANAIIIKPNQIGTISETVDCIRMAQQNDYVPVMANRSAETTDPFIAELSVAMSVPQIKTGAPCRGERTAKYNELIKMESDMDKKDLFWGKSIVGQRR